MMTEREYLMRWAFFFGGIIFAAVIIFLGMVGASRSSCTIMPTQHPSIEMPVVNEIVIEGGWADPDAAIQVQDPSAQVNLTNKEEKNEN